MGHTGTGPHNTSNDGHTNYCRGCVDRQAKIERLTNALATSNTRAEIEIQNRIAEVNGATRLLHEARAENERLTQRVQDAESVIDSINSLRDRAYEEIKRERDECRRLLREACESYYDFGGNEQAYFLGHDWYKAARKAAGGE